jgi:uncharacterized membrane protein YgaE (UPF0421/DUF939 family)
MKIGYRVIKTAIGMPLAMGLAEWLGLQFYVSAGMLTILCIQPTKKRSYQTAWERLAACFIAMGLSFAIFETIGYHLLSLSLLLLVLIPLLVHLKLKDGIMTSMVIILHFFLLKHIDLKTMINETMLLVIGIGIAVLVNMHMPNVEKDLEQIRIEIERNFKTILKEFASYLRDGNSDWDGKEITETSNLLKKAKELALKDIENHLNDANYSYYRYFEIRGKQFEILERIAPTVSSLNNCCIQGYVIAHFLDKLADAVHPGNTAHIFLDELEHMRQEFKKSPLPVTREEFETRAALLHFVNEMRRYLLIKRDLHKETLKPSGRSTNPFVLSRMLPKWKKGE